MTTPQLRNSIDRSPLRLGFFLIMIALASFALSHTARAQLPSPAPDGGYPGNNTAEGDGALFSLTSGLNNTAMGFQALFSNTTGNQNTANGNNALQNNTGSFNTASGASALTSNTTGSSNTATGSGALSSNTLGVNNTANGVAVLTSNTTGVENTATGFFALFSNTTGNQNTANGNNALLSNTTGVENTATGTHALQNNTTGYDNTANGLQALQYNTTGIYNTATGVNTLIFNTIGSYNVGTGDGALEYNTTGTLNTANGWVALSSNTTGSFNIAVGVNAGRNLTTGDSNIDIGNAGVAAEANTIRIGTQGTQRTAFIAGISTTGVMGSAVKINSNGQIGVAPSSARFKQEIRSMDNGSDVLLALRPVTFRYKKEIDPEAVRQFGLVAEEVEKINPDLVAHDADGKPFTVRYEAVNAMLLNEFLKEHRTVQGQQKEIDALKAELKEQKALIQKVSAHIEVTKPAPQVVNNNQ